MTIAQAIRLVSMTDSDSTLEQSQSPQQNGQTWSRAIMRGLRRLRGSDGSARDTLDELIDERDDAEQPLDPDERLLLANILELRNITINDVMVPRADIDALAADAQLSDVINLLNEEGHSRLPVYRETLDDAFGMIHIKDVLTWRGRDAEFKLADIQRKLLFVAPSMQVLELLLEMRATRCHMALVVDEFGGVDGLVTIEDLVEEIVGEIEDEHDRDDDPAFDRLEPGVWSADARAPIELLEAEVGEILDEDDREDLDTLGGLVFSLTGRVPIRGEIVTHTAGLEFEILEADPRRIHRIRIRRQTVADEDANAEP